MTEASCIRIPLATVILLAGSVASAAPLPAAPQPAELGEMKVVTIYTDDTGETHYGELDVELVPRDFAPPAPPLWAASMPSSKLVWITAPLGWHGDWHPAPARQLWIGVEGHIDVTVSDGQTRRFGPGSLLLLEDLTGKGHVTEAVGDTPVRGIFVQLDEEAAPASH